jgi:hypothetical protein
MTIIPIITIKRISRIIILNLWTVGRSSVAAVIGLVGVVAGVGVVGSVLWSGDPAGAVHGRGAAAATAAVVEAAGRESKLVCLHEWKGRREGNIREC